MDEVYTYIHVYTCIYTYERGDGMLMLQTFMGYFKLAFDQRYPRTRNHPPQKLAAVFFKTYCTTIRHDQLQYRKRIASFCELQISLQKFHETYWGSFLEERQGLSGGWVAILNSLYGPVQKNGIN